MIIAIDGTSGSGKSTLAKKIAQTFGFGFFSAGALYRAIAVKVLVQQLDTTDDNVLHDMIQNTNIIYTYDGEKNVMILDGVDITDKLYTEAASNLSAVTAQKPYIREFVRKLQKETALHNENIVMEGRDIGSVIFPDADLKIFVDCKIEERAKRRLKDYKSVGDNVTVEQVVEDLKKRDWQDMHRTLSPLVMCEDAFLIDTTKKTVDDSLMLVLKEMKRRGILTEKLVEKLSEQCIDLE